MTVQVGTRSQIRVVARERRLGTIVRNAGVVVTNVSTGAAATVYSDEDLTSVITSLVTDGSGVFSFYAPPGTYSISFTGSDAFEAVENVHVVGDDTSPTGTYASLDIAGQEKLRTQNASALRAWRTLYGNAAVAAVDVLFVGDSRFEGQNATPTIDNRTISLAVTQMRAARGVSGGRGYIPSWYGISAPTGQGPTTSGTVTQQQNFGFGKRNVSLSTSTANKLTFSFTGTSFKLFYAGGTATGHLGVSIDGGAVTDVDTVQGTTTDGLTSTSAALTPAAHTVDVSWQSGGQVLPDGLFAFDGDEDGNGGIRLWDGAHFGFRSASFAPFGTAAWTNCIPAITNLGLVVISLMTNDEIAVSSAQYKTDMLALIAGIKAKASGSAPPSYLLLCDWERGDATAKIEPHANYVQAVYDIVAADPTLAMLDLTRRMVVAPDAYGTYNADKVHETGVGHRLKSDILATFLTGGV